MAITRVTNFTSGTLAFSDLNSEFNNIVNYINTRVLTNPLSANLDFADLFTITNLRTFWGMINAAEFANLSAAIAALSASGGFIFIPPATTIDISTTVTIDKDNVWIVGCGPSSILRRATGTFTESGGDAFLLFNSRANCGILNLQLDGQQASNTANTGFPAVRVKGTSSNMMFAKLYVRRWGGSSDALTDTNAGIWIGDNESNVPNGVMVVDNVFENIRMDSVRLENGRNIFIDENKINYTAVNAANGIGVIDTGTGRVQGVRISNNRVGDPNLGTFRPADGIKVTANAAPSDNVCDIDVEENSVVNIGNSGITGSNLFKTGIRKNSIRRTMCTAGTGRGIFAGTSDVVEISDNRLSDIGEDQANANLVNLDAITSADNSRVIISDNKVYRCCGVALNVTGSSDEEIIVADNVLLQYLRKHTAATAGVIFNGTMSDVQIVGNRASLDGSASPTANLDGAEFVNGPQTRVLLLGNNFHSSAQGTGEVFDGLESIVDLEKAHNLGEV